MASANVLRTIFTYTVTGLGPYTIAFDYLARKFVQVTLIGPDRKQLVLNTDYRFTSTKAITLIKAAPTGYNQIEIRRYTDATDRLVDFQDGSILRATDLNVSQVQTMHIAEEGRDVASNTLGVDADGNLDARGRKIVNLVDGVFDGDAVTIRQMKSFNDSALNSKNAAAASAAAALLSEQHSKTSETNSKNSENNAGSSASQASGSAGRAATSEANTNSYASLALGSSRNAETKAAEAAGSASAAAASAVTAATEAAKLGNMNDLAAAIDSVSASHLITLKDGLVATALKATTNITGSGNITLDGPASRITVTDIFSGARGAFTGNVTIGGTATLNGDTVTKNMNTQSITSSGMRVATNGISPSNGQGGYWVWNENPNDASKSGATSFINNHGNGTGGFVFRDVNSNNSRQRCQMWLQGDGKLKIERNDSNEGPIHSMILQGGGHGIEWITDVKINGADKYLQFSIDGGGRGINFFDSDATLKYAIVDTIKGRSLEVLDQIRPRSFKWKDNDELQEFGVIAQEIEKILPKSVITPQNTDGTDATKSLNPSVILTFLLCVVKDLKAEIDELKTK